MKWFIKFIMKWFIKFILNILLILLTAFFCSLFLLFAFVLFYAIPISVINCIDPQEGSVEWKMQNGLDKRYDVEYDINSIRVDDDGEYHIVAVSKSGNVETLSDVKYTIDLKYGNYEKPIYSVHFTDYGNMDGRYFRYGDPTVFLPFDYKIETFDD